MKTLQTDFVNKPVKKLFFNFFFPAVLGMLLMSLNMLLDGIFVGHGVGGNSLAGVNLAAPVFTLILALSLWIGIGGATNFSNYVGAGLYRKARSSFTLSLSIFVGTFFIISIIGYTNINTIAKLLGANKDTIEPTTDYLKILFSFGWILGLQEFLSIFIRNDGRPIIGMVSLGITSVVNILLNYIFIFVLGLGVYGAGLATVIGGACGTIVFILHFFKKNVILSKLAWAWSKELLFKIIMIGFPSFFTEIGSFVLIVGYNLSIASSLGTEGVTAFSVINYLHGFLFLAFFGIETALQPMISYYHGAKKNLKIKETLALGEKTGFTLGVILFIIGFSFAPWLVNLFGVHDTEVVNIAVNGIRLFFISYLFIGISFVYMTYFQSVGNVRSAILIIFIRSYVLFLGYLIILPKIIGSNGIWLSMPFAEITTAIFVIVVFKNLVKKKLS
ncbi:TPA: MATE family efflux transporter [Staphylococcus aureus]|nr:MATE family efflux transporter [Staphylococcus aureus]HCD1688022.1 MATE family efflux transporter [Staphylococcus aureus]HCD2285225.1 MATE family efflux transporter [Staphylococcus aureus]HCD2285637.1 MATE family efflux transporter [Staphylococcus aureus]HCD2798336.1 MATE family efflux transporter [Staphylococcus aureus]